MVRLRVQPAISRLPNGNVYDVRIFLYFGGGYSGHNDVVRRGRGRHLGAGVHAL